LREMPLVSVRVSAVRAAIMYRDVPPNVAVAYYKEQAPLQPGEEPEARKTDRGWVTRAMGDGIYLIERIDVG